MQTSLTHAHAQTGTRSLPLRFSLSLHSLSAQLPLSPLLSVSLPALSPLHLSFSLIQFACSARLSAPPLLVHNAPQWHATATVVQQLCARGRGEQHAEFIMATSVEKCRNIANKVDTFAYLIKCFHATHMWQCVAATCKCNCNVAQWAPRGEFRYGLGAFLLPLTGIKLCRVATVLLCGELRQVCVCALLHAMNICECVSVCVHKRNL